MKATTEGRLRVLSVALVPMFLAAPVVASEVTERLPSLASLERVPKFTVIPEYPQVARRDRIEGEVQVCFEITRAGRTRRIAVRKSTNRIFEKPAMKAVRASQYEPLPPTAGLSGIKTCRTFRFSLEPVVAATQDH